MCHSYSTSVFWFQSSVVVVARRSMTQSLIYLQSNQMNRPWERRTHFNYYNSCFCKCWNLSGKHTNAAGLKQLSMDQTPSEDNRSDEEVAFSHGTMFLIIAISHKKFLQSKPGEL